MAEMQVFPSCVALLVDVVDSRGSDRAATHAALLAAIEATNEAVPHLDPLRVTVGDELQGVYASLGTAFAASLRLRNALAGEVDVRFGLGGGEVRVIDASRGIQDGEAWTLAREAIEEVEQRAREHGFAGLRTGIRDGRDVADDLAPALAHLVDAHLDGLGAGARASFSALVEGLDNAATAARLGISPSANSQRVGNNHLRVALEATQALEGCA